MTHVVLLRAVNVGGTKLPMADLRSLLEELGLSGVRTYLQSGNAVFDAAEGEPATALATAIEARLQRAVGARVGVLVLPGEVMRDVAAANPFIIDEAERRPGEAVPDMRTLHATFLFSLQEQTGSGEASVAACSAMFGATFRRLEIPAVDGEEARFVGVPPLGVPVVYLRLPYGYGRTRLNTTWFERKMGAVATTRNWRTISALAEMVDAER